eukprot:9981752-Heterocapsa_arctica.AAC.1
MQSPNVRLDRVVHLPVVIQVGASVDELRVEIVDVRLVVRNNVSQVVASAHGLYTFATRSDPLQKL